MAGTPFRLYFFMQPGCPGCMAAEPELEKFRQVHAGVGMVIPINMRIRRTPVAGFTPEKTPTYLVIAHGEQEGVSHEGMLKAEELEDLLADALDEPGDDEEPDEEEPEDDEPEEDDSDEDEPDEEEEGKEA